MSTTKVFIPSYFPKNQIKENEPSVAIMTITPEIANFWLKTYNTTNRPLNAANVSFICGQMATGQWEPMNGDTISFLENGQLNDGQHRLSAIAKIGKSFKSIVVIGLPERAFKAKDTGKKRTAGDVLSIEGYKNYNNLAAASKFIIAYKRGNIANAAAQNAGSYSTAVSNTDISKFVADNRETIERCCNYAMKLHNGGDRLITVTWLGAFGFLLGEKDAKKSESFLFKLATGSDVTHGSVIYQFRKKLLTAAMSDTKKIPSKTKMAFLIKAWNAERLNKPNKRLTYSPSRGEKFPTII